MSVRRLGARWTWQTSIDPDAGPCPKPTEKPELRGVTQSGEGRSVMVDSGEAGRSREVAAAGGAAPWSADGVAAPRRPESAAPDAEATGRVSAGQRWYRADRAEGRMKGGRCQSPPTSGSGGGRRGGGGAAEPDVSLWFRLVDRDQRLLALLAEHKVLTTRQIAAIEFTSVRRAQDRLRRLREMGVVFTFRRSYVNGGTSETRFALGYVGKRLICALHAKTPPAPKAYAESLERLVVWPKLDH